MPEPDAVVIGSGPNGLAAAIVLARAGLSILVVEAEASIGGGLRSDELTLPGFVHDVCSGIHPFAYASPFFRALPLEQFGLSWVHPPAALAHPFDNGTVAILERSLQRAASTLGLDADAYRRYMQPAVDALRDLEEGAVGLTRLATKPFGVARLGFRGLRSAATVTKREFSNDTARAFFAGNAAHSMLPLENRTTAGIALALLAAGHSGGWPFPRGGAQKLADALAGYFKSLGGKIETRFRVESLAQLPPCRAILCDVSPRQLLRIAGDRLPRRYARILRRYRYGLAAYKMDWALDAPVPWRAPGVARAGTIHLGASYQEIADSGRLAWQGAVSARPFVIAAQHTLFDPTRAPRGKHTLWAYCHVPNGSAIEMAGRIEAQVERFAPGFRERILARHVMPPQALEAHNPNLVGGDILGGRQDLFQLIFRPTLRYYGTPVPNLFLCSSSTPPGAGVHGLCGYFAAQQVLKRVFRQ